MADESVTVAGESLRASVTPVLVSELEKGAFMSDAASSAGCTRMSVHRWLKAAEAEEAPADLKAWSEAVTIARAKGLAVRLRLIAASEDWKAQAWLAERLDTEGELKAPTTRTELTGAEGGPVEVAQVAAQVRERLRRLADAAELPALPALPEGTVKR